MEKLGPLRATFETFLAHERNLVPPAVGDLRRRLGDCTAARDATRLHVADVLGVLRTLQPGGRQVGHREVVDLCNAIHELVRRRFTTMAGATKLSRHGSAFGSGGDLHKTPHATTEAALLISSRKRPFCKTGTGNVTSWHGSEGAIRSFGYREPRVDDEVGLTQIDADLRRYGFSFVSMKSLGVPYSPALRQARNQYWEEGTADLRDALRTAADPHRTMREHTIPIDIFKIISPNAMPLEPDHHSTGVHHLSLVPYVLAIYLDRSMTGVIAHGYDGIDELSTASSNPDVDSPTGLVIQVREDDVRIVETYPERLGLPRSALDDLTHQRTLDREAWEFREIVAGRALGPMRAHRDLAVANAAVLLVAAEATTTYRDADLTDALRDGCRRVLALLGTQALMERMAALSRGRKFVA